MGITKNHIHTQSQVQLARLFKALAHPARIAIIENLLLRKNLNCKELGKHIQLAQSTISKHIKELHDVGILSVTAVANNAFYEVDKIVLEQASDYIDQVFQQIDSNTYDNPFRYIKSVQNIFSYNFISP